MSMLFGENKCMFKAACALAFLLVLILTACDATDVNSPTEIGGLACNDGMEVDGRYLEVINPDGEEYSYSYYKCENGKWISVTEAEVDKAYESTEEDLVFSKCLGVDCHIKRDLADFRKCNAKNEGLVDSTVDLDDSREVSFYTCEDNMWVYDIDATCDAYLRDFEPNILCDESYEIDGAFYKYSSFYNGGCGDRYYKCENNKWIPVSKGDVGAIVYDPFPLKSKDLIQKLYFKKCNAENEGLVDSVVHEAQSKIDETYVTYYKCEQGSWNVADESAACDTAGVALGGDCRMHDYCYKYLGNGAWDPIICLDGLLPQCDTAGVSVGAICTKSHCYRTKTSMGYYSPICSGDNTYIYMGNGAWKILTHTTDNGDRKNFADSSWAQWTKECTAENEGETEKHIYGIAPNVAELYYKCVDGKWTDMSETDYYCTTEKTDVGDTCTVTVGDSTRHYMFMNVGHYWEDSYLENSWLESTVDPVLGYCPLARTETEWRYAQKDEKYYYCDEGKWLEASLVPHQYTDPRKEGLTDEEYDVLDLPKEASVGDRAGGLLENCSDNEKFGLGGPDEWRYETYDYCMSKNYYRYRENGSWTLETETELEMNYAIPCTAGTEGVEYTLLPRPREPGRIYKRISIKCDPITDPNSIIKEECYCADDLVEYIFGRYEKKD